MDLLLDTHTLIWFSNGDKTLSKKSREAIEDPSNKKYVSIASLWEIAIKQSIGRLVLKRGLIELKTFIDESEFIILGISFNHTLHLLNMKFNHRDPFDRLLIAQAIEEDFQIVTKDKNFSTYKIKTIW